MTVVILNGARSCADLTHSLCIEVECQLAAQFTTVRSLHLAGYDIGHCTGEFDCFVKTPGRCRIHDEGQEIERAHWFRAFTKTHALNLGSPAWGPPSLGAIQRPGAALRPVPLSPAVNPARRATQPCENPADP